MEDIEVANKEEKLKIAKLEKQVELLEKAKALVSKGESEMGKAIPYLQEVLNMEDKKIAELQKDIDETEKNCSSYSDSRGQS